MKILHFITDIDAHSGGPSRSVPLLVKGQAEIGIEVTLMTQDTVNTNKHVLDNSSAKLYLLENGFKVKDIEQFITNNDFDLIQMHSIWHPLYHKVSKIARRNHIPYIITPRGMLEPWSLRQKWLKKKLAMLAYQRKDLNLASCVFTTADEEARHVKELGIKTCCSVIPNGIEIEGYPCRKKADDVEKQILFLSRIHEKKGIELLIDAWKKMNEDYPNWHIKIVGNGEKGYIQKLKSKVANANLEKCIEILPPVFGLAKVDLYQKSALFVLPSYSENFGMVVAEALSCGVPVITSEYTPWQVLNETKIGWCIPLSEDCLEKTLREAIEMFPEKLFEMGQNGSTFVEERFEYRSVAAMTIKLYEWILNGGDKPNFIY